MNGMRQGLIIGAVAGLFFGFLLGRYGAQKHYQLTNLSVSSGHQRIAKKRKRRIVRRGRSFSLMRQLPRNYIRPHQHKNIRWKGLHGYKLVWATKVLNVVPCRCGRDKHSLAYCVRYASQCKPDMKKVRGIFSQISDGVHYTRVLARLAGKKYDRPSKKVHVIANIDKILAKIARENIVIGHAPSVGPKHALVTIVEFSDFQCPFCQQSFPIVKQMIAKYSEYIRFVYLDFPIVNIHPLAVKASHAARCADEQGKFWQYHDSLFQNQDRLDEELFSILAEMNNLDKDDFDKCMASEKYLRNIQEQLDLGQELGVTGTPTFFINGHRLPGVIPSDVWDEIMNVLIYGEGINE